MLRIRNGFLFIFTLISSLGSIFASPTRLVDLGLPAVNLELKGHFFDATAQAYFVYGYFILSDYGPIDYRINKVDRGIQTDFIRTNNQFVYDIYQNEGVTREVFDQQFIEKLQKEDGSLPKSRVLQFSLTPPDNKLTHLTFGLFDGTPYETDSDFLLPIERKYPGIKLLRLPNTGVFEIRRTAKWRDSKVNIKIISKLIDFHMRITGNQDFILYVHTDRVGARYYKALGFQVKFGPNELDGKNEFVLAMNSQTFREKFSTIKFQDGYNQRSICPLLFRGS